MPTKEWRSQLRAGVYRGDGRTVVALAGAYRPDDTGDVLQLLGDGLIAALAGQVTGAPGLAAGCVTALRERRWSGDAELADQLQALLGTGPTPMLRPLPVDLEELTGILEGDPVHGGGRVDLQTGEVWPRVALDYAQENGEEMGADDVDPQRWLWVESEGSHAGYRDMEVFIDSLADPDGADRLRIAIQGRGAFRRFKDVLGRFPDELDRWHAFSEERQRGRARAWLADAGYSVRPCPPRRPEV